jgi:hypothetical protein
MASGFFAVFDDIAVLLDDVAAMSKIATKKTAGILGDDLAVNAQKASGFASKRELPVLWAIAKGSFINKLLILPVVFLLSAYASWLIIPILLIGGVYLAYEGAEKIYEYFVPHVDNREKLKEGASKEEILEFEQSKIKSAILTDFILSIEIIIIALGTVMDKPLSIQISVVSIIAIIATIGVYGIVALIVRMDDFGYKIMMIDNGNSAIANKIGQILVDALPKVIRILTVVGTLAMILVAGGIYAHNIHAISDFLHFLPSLLAEFLVGLVVGAISLGVVNIFKKGRLNYRV